MDQNVIDAQIRWPDVPAAFGWLSLDPRGNFRLHEAGTSGNGAPGDAIANQQIIGFMHRNYTHDDQGRWFFQNGPQRVYVRLDAAPLVLHDTGNRTFVAHTGEPSGPVQHWWLDDGGHLYARTSLGPGMVVDRDLLPVLDAMTSVDVNAGHVTTDPSSNGMGVGDASNGMGAGDALLDLLSRLKPGERLMIEHPASEGPVPLDKIAEQDVPDTLGFVRAPEAASQ